MTTHKMILVGLGAAAFAVPAFADDSTTTSSVPSAKEQCRTEVSSMGKPAFRAAYKANRGSRSAFGKCIVERRHATREIRHEAHSDAVQTCRDERDADADAFQTNYGSNDKAHGKGARRNAFGKCVSQHAKAQASDEVSADVEDDVNAAQECKAERKADRDAFREQYGNNHNKRNAFGRCVNTKKAEQDQATTEDTSSSSESTDS